MINSGMINNWVKIQSWVRAKIVIEMEIRLLNIPRTTIV